MTCYFCHRTLGGYYETAFVQWEIKSIDGPPDTGMKEKAHLACLERAQGIFAKAQGAGGSA